MPFSTYPVDRFGGLDLVTDPQQVGPNVALDASDVIHSTPGVLRTRPGTNILYTPGINDIHWTVKRSHSGHVLVLRQATTVSIQAIDPATGLEAANVTSAGNTGGFDTAIVRQVSTGGAETTYLSGATTFQIRKWTGSVFQSPAGLAAIRATAMASWDSRLVIVDANTTGRVLFSNAGDPETFTYTAGPPATGDYVDFPTAILGLAAWRELLFIFEATRFHIVSSTSTSNTGGAVFNYRTVDTGVGCTSQFGGEIYNELVTVGRDGVYFVSLDGIYRTAGDTPVRVSDPIAPIWPINGYALPSQYTTPDAWHSIGMVRDQLFACTGTSTWVFEKGEWAHFALPTPMQFIIPATSSSDVGYFTAEGTGKGLRKMSYSFTTDAGTGISWRWQSGWTDLGTSGVKTTRWTRLWGSGTPTVSVFTDMDSTDARAGAVTLGTSPVVAEGYHQQAYQGQLFSTKLSGTGAVSINRVQHDVAGVRP